MITFDIGVNATPVTKFSVVRKPGPDGSFDYDGDVGVIYSWTSWRPESDDSPRACDLAQYTRSEVAHDPDDPVEILVLRVLEDWKRLRFDQDAFRPEPAMLSVAELAQKLGCTVRWIEDRCRSGKFPGRKLHRRWRFTEDDVQEILRLVAVPAREAAPERTFIDDRGYRWEWCGGEPGTWAWRRTDR